MSFEALAIFKIEICCMVLAFVDKQAKGMKGPKCVY